jgi:hypothetical protein
MRGADVSKWILVAALTACSSLGGGTAPASEDTSFAGPFSVTILGYDGHAMEPFLTRDGQHLLFNNRNAPADSTDLHIATRVSDGTFQYDGPLGALNGATLDAVPTGASNGNIYFVSLRAYDSTFSTIFSSTLVGTSASPPTRVTSIATTGGGWLDFDVDVAADDQSLILARGRFTGAAFPAEADLKLFVRVGPGFAAAADSDARFAAVNTAALEYAPAISADGLELSFTRWDVGTGDPVLMLARRATLASAWDAPRRLRGPQGIVEAGTWSPDGRTLYFHANVAGRYVIQRMTR